MGQSRGDKSGQCCNKLNSSSSKVCYRWHPRPPPTLAAPLPLQERFSNSKWALGYFTLLCHVHLCFLDALASLDFTLVSESVSESAEFRIWAFKPVYIRQKTLDHDQGSCHHVILSSCHLVILSSSCHLVILSSSCRLVVLSFGRQKRRFAL